ncbi:hypothetical protein [Pedobacter jejuensis]|uniref:DUF4398 domain-containing protein n=1 Tax=Pedobacter jejuensis TaxID=1268550 RepID=A0A3N0BXV6_9SPHI|nr:hypothetical protein [Pedobacter jejuensis]RNL54165.1 hypothetical protein D7004_08715 [Pedobacter jejuensis]
MIKFKLTILSILTLLLFSCTSSESSENKISSETEPTNYAETPVNAPANNDSQASSVLPQRHEPITTEEKKYNGDGSVTVTRITTDGVEVKKSDETFFPNDVNDSIRAPGKEFVTSNFDEAYNYARKAYLSSEDVEIASEYLKKAMSYFEDAESDADDVSCDDARSSASDGYSYAKKGYNETDPSEIESFAKKAMNEAENGKSAMGDCKRNKERGF